MNRILIVNVNWLGDTLFATPFIRAIKENFPQAHIAVFTHPRCKEILDGNPNIDEIIMYDEKGEHRHLWAKFSIISKLKSEKFDAAFILRKSLSRTMILFLSNITERIGYSSKRAGFLLTKKIPLPKKDLHRVEHFLDIARAIGIEPKSLNYDFFISEEDIKKADEILNENGIGLQGKYIALHAGGNWMPKRWPFENFAKLADEICHRLKYKVVFTGTEKDLILVKNICGLMKVKPIVLCGKINLKVLGAVFERSACMISNDSGPLHIAYSLKVPVIGLFGPTSPEITGPYGGNVKKLIWKDTGCKVPCYKLDCHDNKCMKVITVEEVFEAVKGMVGKSL